MNNALGVWTMKTAALVLIDYQKEIWSHRSRRERIWRSSTSVSWREPPSVQHADRALDGWRRVQDQFADSFVDSIELSGIPPNRRGHR